MAVQQNGINFPNVYSDSAYSFGDSLVSENPGAPLINACEIDWNGAILNNSNPSNGGKFTLDTEAGTGKLLWLINEMQKEIYALTAAVIALANKN